MKKKSCRRTGTEREQHERAIRVRKMTDAQLCEYLDGLEAGSCPAGPSKEEIVEEFLDSLRIRTDDGIRVSDATIRKISMMARRRGFLPKIELTEDLV